MSEALEIQVTVLDPHHPHVDASLQGAAGICNLMGEYTQAEQWYRDALAILGTVKREDHPDFALSLHDLATLYVATAPASEALSLLRQAAAIDDRMIGQVFSIGSERQRTAFIAIVQAWRRLVHEELQLIPSNWKNVSVFVSSISAICMRSGPSDHHNFSESGEQVDQLGPECFDVDLRRGAPAKDASGGTADPWENYRQ